MSSEMEELALLRATTQRLNTTPIEELPRVASFLSSSLARCSSLLNEAETKPVAASVPLHRLKTRISSLLQDRTASGRFTAAILIKAFVETGLPDTAGLWESWTRGLLACLNKPDPHEVKKVYLSTVVRIFLLSQDRPTFQREITTPLLPTLITTCIGIIRPLISSNGQGPVTITSPLLPLVLRGWNELLQKNGPTFRPFVTRIKPICLSIVGDSASASPVREAATKVLSSLHLCAPKGAASAEWELALSTTIQAAHNVADQTFRAVREEWVPNNITNGKNPLQHDFSKFPENPAVDVAGLGPWKGLHQGLFRLVRQLGLIQGLLLCHIPPAHAKLGLVLDLTSRLLSVVSPRATSSGECSLRLNPEVSKEEKDQLWAGLPYLHVECITILTCVAETYQQAVIPIYQALGNQVLDIFMAENWHEEIRAHAYNSLSTLIRVSKTSSPQLDRGAIISLSKTCCRDLSASIAIEKDRPTFGGPRDKSSWLAVAEAAWELLPLLIENLPRLCLPQSLRAEMDRVSILMNHETAMLASVLNPLQAAASQRRTPSILPFFAQASTDSMTLEALLRPRLPAVPGTTSERKENGEDKFDIDEAIENFSDEDRLSRLDGMIDGRADKPIRGLTPEEPSTIETHVADYEECFGEQVTKKRDFAATEDDSGPATATAVDSTAEPTKKPRVKEANTDSGYALPDHQSQNSMRLETSQMDARQIIPALLETSNAGSATADRSITVPSQFDVAKASAAVQSPGDDSESEFEMPEINPEPATDDEDDMDED